MLIYELPRGADITRVTGPRVAEVEGVATTAAVGVALGVGVAEVEAEALAETVGVTTGDVLWFDITICTMPMTPRIKMDAMAGTFQDNDFFSRGTWITLLSTSES